MRVYRAINSYTLVNLCTYTPAVRASTFLFPGPAAGLLFGGGFDQGKTFFKAQVGRNLVFRNLNVLFTGLDVGSVPSVQYLDIRILLKFLDGLFRIGFPFCPNKFDGTVSENGIRIIGLRNRNKFFVMQYIRAK